MLCDLVSMWMRELLGEIMPRRNLYTKLQVLNFRILTPEIKKHLPTCNLIENPSTIDLSQEKDSRRYTAHVISG